MQVFPEVHVDTKYLMGRHDINLNTLRHTRTMSCTCRLYSSICAILQYLTSRAGIHLKKWPIFRNKADQSWYPETPL